MAKGTINVVIAGNSELLNKELRAVERRLKRFGNGLKTIGDSIFTSVGVPFIAAGAAGVKAASDFESSLSKIKGLVGIAGEDLKQLENAALRLGPQMGKSATEAAEALFFITSAGLKGKDAIDVLEMSLKASAAGLGEVSTIADLATSVMNAYGAENVSAANATDTLTAAVREGKLQADTLAGAVSAVLPIASAMGVQFNEVGAAFAAMSRTGTSADEAATQLKGILSSLLKPTVEAEEALAGMGLSSEMLRQQIKEEGLLSVLELLNNRFDGNTAATAKVFGNVRALTGVLDLMGKNADGTRQIFERMNSVAGDTDKAFGAAAQTTEFKFNQALAKLNSAAIKLGGDLIPVVTEIISTIQLLVDKFLGLDDGTRKAIVSSLKWITIISGGMSVVGRMVNGIAGLLSGLRAIGATTLFANIVSGFKAIITTGTTANIVIRSLGIGLTNLARITAGPLALLIASLEGLQRAMSMDNIVGKLTRQLYTMNSTVRWLLNSYVKLKGAIFGTKNEIEDFPVASEICTNEIDNQSASVDNLANSYNQLNPVLDNLAQKQNEQQEYLESVKSVYSGLAKELEFLTAKQELYGGSLDSERVSAYQSAIDNLLKLGINPASKGVQDLYNKMMQLQQALSERTVEPLMTLPTLKPEGVKTEETGLVMPDVLPNVVNMNESVESVDQLTEAFNNAQMAGQQFADIFKQASESSSSAAEAMGKTILKVATKTIKSALLSALAQWISGSISKLGPLGVPLAGAGYGILQGLFNAGANFNIPQLAQGGMTTGPGMAMIGDNASGKEFVIPFERMGEFARQAMGGSNVNLSGEFRIKGSDLVLTLERANRMTTAMRGYGLNE